MDLTSRFQNPISLSSGGFSKHQPSQNDGVGTKLIPSLILDRFRAMVKKKEGELRVFQDGEGLLLNTDEIVRIYENLLSELTMNLKPIITDLTIIAGEQRVHGEGIAGAICSRIIEVSVDQKLPSLYLLDSIVKNIGKDYIKYFTVNLPEVFCEAYAQVHPNMQSAMRHLFGTWSSVFPLSVLQIIESQLQFPLSVNGRTSSASKASESSRPLGIHVNPKYIEAQNQFGHSTVDTFGTEKKPIVRIIKSSSPYRIGSLSSPSAEDFSMDNKRTTVRDDWQKRIYQVNPNSSQQLEYAPDAYKYKNNRDIDLRGPRALISAYGRDEREKNMSRHTNSDVDQNAAISPWQNTEEEEFEWEDMTTPGLIDWSSDDVVSSSLARNSFAKNHGASFVNGFRGNLSKEQLLSIAKSLIDEDVSNIIDRHEKINGVLPNVAVGPNNIRNRIPPTVAGESLILPHQLPQSHFNTKENHPLSGSWNLLTGDQQSPSLIRNFSNTGAKFDGPSSTFNPTYDSAATNLHLVDAKACNPANFHSSLVMPSHTAPHPHMQIRGHHGLQKTFPSQVHSEQYPGSTKTMPQPVLPQVPNYRPRLGPVNLQTTAQRPLGQQPNMLRPQYPRQNLHLPSSNAMVPPLSHGYLGQEQDPHSSLPTSNTLNALFHSHRPPLITTNQALPICQRPLMPSTGTVLSGLFSSLMAQGLISLTKQDSVGVEFAPDSLKIRHESAITALYSNLPRQCTTCGLRFRTQEEHSKHMDWHVNRNRSLKNRKTKPSPKWFVSVTMWLSGAEALGTETAPGFPQAENILEKEEEDEVAVPAVDDQNVCALCGEPFDDFYSDEREEWMYRGAVYINGPTLGMERSEVGPIVHAKCRSDSNGVSFEDFKKDERESTEEGSQRKRLRISLS